MDGKSYLLIAALVASGALAGCVEAPGFLSIADAEATALDNKDLADGAAAAWHPDAKLVGFMTLELTESEDEARLPPDPEVGNGRALAWWYTYCLESEGEDMEIRVYKVTADGQVTQEKEAEAMAMAQGGMDMDVLENVAIDSDAAIGAAKTNDTFRAAAEGFNATVIQGVAVKDDVAEYWIVATSASGMVVASVDAMTGELREVHSMNLDFAIPAWSWGGEEMAMWTGEDVEIEGEGRLDRDASKVEYPFTLGGPSYGVLDLTVGTDLPSDNLRWAIVDGEGEEVAEGWFGGWFSGESDDTMDIEIEKPGAYTLVLGYAPYLGFVPVPAGGVDYEFTLELEPGFGHEEDAH